MENQTGGRRSMATDETKERFHRERNERIASKCIVALISGGISRLINENRDQRPFIILANYQL